MNSNPFGWRYPAGAEHDPNAPYNQEPEPDCCPVCGAENGGAWGIYCSRRCRDIHEDDSFDEDGPGGRRRSL